MDIRKVKYIDDLVFHDRGKRIYPRKLIRAFGKACKRAGVEDFHFHDLRHTFASYLRQRGVDIHIIAKLLGHKDMRMTQRYAHLCVENLKDAISALDKNQSFTFLSRSGAEGGAAAPQPLEKLVVPTGLEPVS